VAIRNLADLIVEDDAASRPPSAGRRPIERRSLRRGVRRRRLEFEQVAADRAVADDRRGHPDAAGDPVVTDRHEPEGIIVETARCPR